MTVGDGCTLTVTSQFPCDGGCTSTVPKCMKWRVYPTLTSHVTAGVFLPYPHIPNGGCKYRTPAELTCVTLGAPFARAWSQLNRRVAPRVVWPTPVDRRGAVTTDRRANTADTAGTRQIRQHQPVLVTSSGTVHSACRTAMYPDSGPAVAASARQRRSHHEGERLSCTLHTAQCTDSILDHRSVTS